MHTRCSLSLLLLVVPSLGGTTACTTDTDTTDTTLVTTSVVVDPAQFLGGLPCGVEGGAATYTATAIDVETLEPVGQSGAVSCGAKLTFTNIEAGKKYGAQIHIQDGNGQEAWSTECGLAGTGAAVATSSRQVVIAGCNPIAPVGNATTAIAIDLAAVTAELGCTGDVDGLVFETTVTPVAPEGTTLPEVTVPCGDAPVRYGAGIEPGVDYTFRLVATDFPLEQRWGSTCTARAEAGFVTTASCTPLTKNATLVFPVTQALADVGLTCGDGASAAVIALTQGPERLAKTVVGCDADAVINNFPAGSYQGSLELLDHGVEKAFFSCSVTAEPGASATLDCAP